MRILLIDDSVKQRRAGKRQLEELGHEVVLASSYIEAISILREHQVFDAVLCDLMMGAEEHMLGVEAQVEHLGREIGVGYAMAFMAAEAKAGGIAVVTDGNHHAHPMVTLMDWLQHLPRPFMVGDTEVQFHYAQLTEDGVKDWEHALRELHHQEL